MWAEYKNLDTKKKKAYFSQATTFKEKITAHCSGNQAPLVEDIDAPIVDVLIVQMLLDNEEEPEKALRSFEEIVDTPAQGQFVTSGEFRKRSQIFVMRWSVAGDEASMVPKCSNCLS